MSFDTKSASRCDEIYACFTCLCLLGGISNLLVVVFKYILLQKRNEILHWIYVMIDLRRCKLIPRNYLGLRNVLRRYV
jgi:hypothetical protein